MLKTFGFFRDLQILCKSYLYHIYKGGFYTMKLNSKWLSTAVVTVAAAAMLTGCGGGGEKRLRLPRRRAPPVKS